MKMTRLCLLVLLGSVSLLADGPQPNKVGVSEWDNVLPQVADGNGWSSRITLVNMDNVAATVDLLFYHDDGTPWNIGFKGQTGTKSDWTFTIPIGGSVFLETPNTDSTVSQGWAYLKTSQWVSGVGAFKASWLATNDMEAFVPFTSEVDTRFFIPFDNRGYVTSIAIANPDTSTTASIAVQFRNPDGSVFLTDTITLPPLQHKAFETTVQYPQTNGLNGTIQFTVGPRQADGTPIGRASALGLLFNDSRHSFTSVNPVSVDPIYCYYSGIGYCSYI